MHHVNIVAQYLSMKAWVAFHKQSCCLYNVLN